MTKEDVSFLVDQLHDYAYKWRRIGVALRFRYGELENIRHNASWYADTTILLTALLDAWSQWPTRSHCTVPTLERLCAALRSDMVGLGAEANALHSMRSQLPSQGNARCVESQISPTLYSFKRLNQSHDLKGISVGGL